MSSLKSAITMAVLFVVLPLLFLGIGSRAISFIIPTLIALSVRCARSLSRESRGRCGMPDR
jgi:hypothetical protein